MATIENKHYDEERALYRLQDSIVAHCTFAGAQDGESPLKETNRIAVKECTFSLRYPLWHTSNARVIDCSFDNLSRAAFWYVNGALVERCTLDGIKAFRECADVTIQDCTAHSPEFGWRCNGLTLRDSAFESEYFLFESKRIAAERITLQGKYSFQYVTDSTVKDAKLYTKDAFWHAHNVTVKDTLIKGEYTGWYSDGLTLKNCVIEGTQPFCYCKNLKLINCRMVNCDLAFEYSDVDATVAGHIDSIVNVHSGKVVADSFGEILTTPDAVYPPKGQCIVRKA